MEPQKQKTTSTHQPETDPHHLLPSPSASRLSDFENDQEQLASRLPRKMKSGRNHHKPWLKYPTMPDENEEQDEKSGDEDNSKKKHAKSSKKSDDEKSEKKDDQKKDSKKKETKNASKKTASKKDEDKDEDEQDDKKNDQEDDEKNPKNEKRWTPKRIIGASAVALLLLVGAFYFFYERYTYESTDDALVAAHSTMLAPKVSGIVTQVLVDEHQRVHAGQVLARLEQKDYLSNLASAKANLGSMQVQYNNARRDYGRAAQLYKEHAITHQSYDHAYANYQDLDRQAKAAKSAVDQAQLNLEYTELRAPTDGFVSRKSVEVGMNAVAGTALMGFVQNDDRWVIANFKETQLDSVKIGKQVNITIDALPGKKYQGIIESISPSSGAAFTLFPPDNATGNFTKVVQRVPVRIYLKNLSQQDLMLLQAGLSAEVDVIKHSDTEALPPNPNANYISQFAESLPRDPRVRAPNLDSQSDSITTTQSSRDENPIARDRAPKDDGAYNNNEHNDVPRRHVADPKATDPKTVETIDQ